VAYHRIDGRVERASFLAELNDVSSDDERQLRKAVLDVKEAILKGDTKGLLRQVCSEGLTCTDTNYSYGRIRTFLDDKKSHLFLGLFDSAGFSQQCGGGYPSEYPAISEQDFLRTANDSVSIVRLETDWAQVTLTSPNIRHYPREWYFHKESGRWKLAGDSWIVGRCSCG
jgi:hypothetical protein